LDFSHPRLITANSYPVLDAQTRIKGNSLLILRAQGTIEIRAPKKYLRKLLEWCQGKQTMHDLLALSAETWGNAEFIDFLHDLIHTGVLSVKHAPHNPGPALNLRKLTTTVTPCTATAITGQAAEGPACPSGVLCVMLEIVKAVAGRHASVVPCLHIHLIVHSPLEDIPAGIYAVDMSSQEMTISCVSSDLRQAPRAFNRPHVLQNTYGILVISTTALQAETMPEGLPPGSRPLTIDLARNLQRAESELGICWNEITHADQRWLKFVCGLPQSHHILMSGSVAPVGAGTGTDYISQPSLEFKWSEALERVTFHLAQAKIDWGLDRASQGWGRAEDPALTCDKAVAEAVERYAYSRYVQCQLARSCELDNVIPPKNIVRYSRFQYRQKRFLLQPFSSREPRLWMRAHEITSGCATWVLADCVLHPNAFPADYRSRLYTYATSSGCASAPTTEQAILNATLELIERDAFMRHWFAQCGGYNVPLKTLPTQLRSRLDLLHRSGCVIQVQCLHLGRFPVWMVLAQHAELHFTCIGAGSGLNAEEALASAVSEMETQAHARLDGVSVTAIRLSDVKSPADHGSLYTMQRFFKKADALMACTSSENYADIARCFSVTAEQLFRHLNDAGHTPAWIDLSVPNAPRTLSGAALHTVRVIAPGLIPIAFGSVHMPLGMDIYGHPGSRFPHPFM
jgi:ribosomal protein S12 methylthiotransferase accessory factor